MAPDPINCGPHLRTIVAYTVYINFHRLVMAMIQEAFCLLWNTLELKI